VQLRGCHPEFSDAKVLDVTRGGRDEKRIRKIGMAGHGFLIRYDIYADVQLGDVSVMGKLGWSVRLNHAS
jgi:hypothetical protein